MSILKRAERATTLHENIDLVHYTFADRIRQRNEGKAANNVADVTES